MSPLHSSILRISTRRRTAILGILSVFLVCTAVWWWRANGRASLEARSASLALDHGRTQEASAAVERLLKSSPNSADAHYLKARIAWIQKDLLTLEEELARAEQLGYSWGQLARLRGLLFAARNQKSEAEPFLRWEFGNSNKPDPEVSDALARVYMETFRLEESAQVLERWMRDAPDDARPHLLRAEIDVRIKAPSETIIARFQEALKRDPSLARARQGLASELFQSNRFAEAASEYLAYLSLQPNDPLGYLGACQNALKMGDQPTAQTLIDRALALAPHDADILAAQATLALQKGQLEKALHFFDLSIKADAFNHRNRYQRMLILSRLGRKAEAEDERQTVERLKLEEGRFADIGKALLRNPTDSQLRSEAARWLMDHGHDEEAVDWANLVLQSNPSDPAMNRLLADYYRKKGQIGLANFYEAPLAGSDRHPALPNP